MFIFEPRRPMLLLHLTLNGLMKNLDVNSLFFKEEHKMIKEMDRDFAITKIAPVAS